MEHASEAVMRSTLVSARSIEESARLPTDTLARVLMTSSTELAWLAKDKHESAVMVVAAR
jgi:hypothetical protein